MPNPTPADHSLTDLLQQWRQGSGTAFNDLIEQVYDQLHAIAAKRVNQGGGLATLSPTELVHEALIGAMPAPMEFKNRVHFFATMSLAIRSILVDHARARFAEKRGGGMVRVTLTGANLGEDSAIFDILAIEQALTQLELLDARCAQTLHLTYFGGLTREEIASLLDVSLSTVDRELHFARAWLNKAMAGEV